MSWLAALSAVAKLVPTILEMARERETTSAGRAEAVAESATNALPLIRKARDARRAASDAVADPNRLRDNDGFRWTEAVACSTFEPILWSKTDTDETIRQVKGHNAARKAVCLREE
jgi:hypothetical protein